MCLFRNLNAKEAGSPELGREIVGGSVVLDLLLFPCFDRLPCQKARTSLIIMIRI